MNKKLYPASSTNLFAGLVAFFSPLIPPSTRALFCYHKGQVATEEHAAEVNVLFGVHGRPDELADRYALFSPSRPQLPLDAMNKLKMGRLDRLRLRALEKDLVDHSWIFESCEQHSKLDFADYFFSHLDKIAQPHRDQPSATTREECMSETQSIPERRCENENREAELEEASFPDPLRSIRTPPITPSFAVPSLANLSPEDCVPAKRSLVTCPTATSVPQEHCQMPVIFNEDEAQSNAPDCSRRIEFAAEQETTSKRIDPKQNGSIIETSSATDLKTNSVHSLLSREEEHQQVSKDVKLESDEEVSTPQPSTASSSTSPNRTKTVKSVETFSPSHSPDRSFNPFAPSGLSDFWSNLSSGHPRTSDPTAPLTIPAEDFLATLGPLEDQNQESDYAYLRYGLSLMEHGQNGFVAKRKGDTKAVGEKKKRKTGG
ncbi:hypothetical protein JCM3765_004244 [Sporobolomyces pararoseus]